MSGEPESPPPAVDPAPENRWPLNRNDARRRANRPVIWVAVVVVLGGVGLGLWYAATPNSKRPAHLGTAASGHTGATRGRSATSTTTTTLLPTTTTTTMDPGLLPQTDALPSAATPQFQSEMQDLFEGVVTDSVSAALPSYFPEHAYLQLKMIDNPESDYTNRLLHDFTLDLGAAHALFGADVASVRLVQVNVPANFGHWIPPGVCDNRDGYFEVADSRVVYQ